MSDYAPAVERAAPYVYQLWKQTGESTYLGIKNGDSVLYIQHYDRTKDFRVFGI